MMLSNSLDAVLCDKITQIGVRQKCPRSVQVTIALREFDYFAAFQERRQLHSQMALLSKNFLVYFLKLNLRMRIFVPKK